MALKRIWYPSPHHSGRSGSVRLVVLHTTEGATTIESLANWFANPAAKVSSHVGADNQRIGTIAEYVRRDRAAWAQGNYNSASICIEMCTPAGAANGWSRDYWLSKQGWLLDNTAAWIAEEARFYGIPVVKLSPSQATGGGRGLCGHVDIQPQDRTDPGRGFPWDYVISKATGGQPAEPPKQEVDVSADVAYDRDGNPHFAWLSSRGQIMYFPPGRGEAYAVDSTQTGAKSGVGIAISPANLVMIAYTNGGGAPCTYQKPVNTGSWSWASRGPGNSAR
jgi:hypothetical protein